MNSNKLMWALVAFCITATLAIVFDVADVRSQEKSNISPKETPPIANPDLSKYGVADYEGVVSLNAIELEQRKQLNARYDNQEWVTKNVHPETGKVGRHTESTPPPLIPVQESDVVIIGRVLSVEAYLSNDKSGIYSQYTIKVDQSLKNTLGKKLERGVLIQIDRAGGVVRYPNGQSVLYLDIDKGLPEVGREYAFFLKSENKGESLAIVSLYELQRNQTVPLDSGHSADEIKRLGRSSFIEKIRAKLS